MARKPEVGLTHLADAAVAFLIEDLRDNPDPEHAATTSGALCKAAVEYARARGWNPPEGT